MLFIEDCLPSPNCDRQHAHGRRGVLIHHTVMSYEQTIAYMLEPSSRVSYHAVISKSGKRCQLVKDEHIAWHAGVSTFQGRSDCNQFLLGLSFEGDTYREALTESQIASALDWLSSRWSAYQLRPDRLVDHRQVSPGRKDDLNPSEWDRFMAALTAWAKHQR